MRIGSINNQDSSVKNPPNKVFFPKEGPVHYWHERDLTIGRAWICTQKPRLRLIWSHIFCLPDRLQYVGTFSILSNVQGLADAQNDSVSQMCDMTHSHMWHASQKDAVKTLVLLYCSSMGHCISLVRARPPSRCLRARTHCPLLSKKIGASAPMAFEKHVFTHGLVQDNVWSEFVCVRLSAWRDSFIYIYMYIYKYIDLFIYVYIYMKIYRYKDIYTYIYILLKNGEIAV